MHNVRNGDSNCLCETNCCVFASMSYVRPHTNRCFSIAHAHYLSNSKSVKMADSLRRLVNIGTFNVLQEKLERWLDNYYLNTCDQNVARGCEIIELNSKVQGQLFKLLSVCAQEGGMYGGASVIKSRLLPFLGQNFFTSGATTDTSLSVIAEATAKNREIDEIQDQYEESLRDLECDLRAKELENQDLRDELIEAKDDLNRSIRNSSSAKIIEDMEVRELRRKLAAAEDELRNLRAKAGILSDYDIQVRRLREDIALLTGRRDALLRSSTTLREELPSYRPSTPSKFKSEDPPLSGDTIDSLSKYRYTPRVSSPLSMDDPVQRVRETNLISRWNDLFSQDRLDAMDTLRTAFINYEYPPDHENIQRIVFEAVKESFNVAKTAFRQFKMKVRSNLAITHTGPETLEEAVQDYINRNVDLYDAPGMVSTFNGLGTVSLWDVIRKLNVNPSIFLPRDTTFAVIQPFIRECVKVAWQMSALAHSLDISVASKAELFDDTKYRRSYDSEYTAPLVNHHIWPCLAQGPHIRMKGECCTRRGASLHNITREQELSRRSRSPTRSRSVSPGPRSRSRSRSQSPTRRSRSPSPRRSGFQQVY
ncbi:mitochondria-eating protein-like isoform X2 [Mercenaria mercenaria]|uniref:mitochondria-eating protein-like isoform X2 n=1 Tax=Mercenaria mercenaria TaxID=6596 RepID=UPI00234E592D|nr:mitochondria-eating protein-like isoform X2 [Mercenaria mercenaria]